MTPRIEISPERKLVGKRQEMSFADYKVSELWKSFMLHRSQISNAVKDSFVSMVVYSPSHFMNFRPTNQFEKWAAVEVSDFDKVPAEMETYVLAAGLYAVFAYKGLNSDHSVYQYIFGNWLPASDYILDNRPHFEILGDKYRNNDPSSEEEIWIPIKPNQ
jgi:AraC family transcriptional regulator